MEVPATNDEAQYTNRELREFFGNISKDISEIKIQTRKTNGRVNKLENWKWALIGGWVVLTAIVLPIAAVFLRAYLIGKL